MYSLQKYTYMYVGICSNRNNKTRNKSKSLSHPRAPHIIKIHPSTHYPNFSSQFLILIFQVNRRVFFKNPTICIHLLPINLHTTVFVYIYTHYIAYNLISILIPNI